MPMRIRRSVWLEREEEFRMEELKEEEAAREHRPNFKRASKRASLMEAKTQRKKMKKIEERRKGRRSDLEDLVVSI